MNKVIQWWFDNAVWPFSEKTGLDTWESQCVLVGGPMIWFGLMFVGFCWWKSLKRKHKKEAIQ